MSSLRRSPRLAELAAKKAEKEKKTSVLAVETNKKPAEKPVEEAIQQNTPNKKSINMLRLRAVFMGILYKNMIPGYKEVVDELCGTIEVLHNKNDIPSITYCNYLYNSLKNAVNGHMFFHPDDIASVKKDYMNDFHTYAAQAKVLLEPASKNGNKTNIDHYIDVLYHFIEDPILISQESRLRHVVMGRLENLEDYIVKKNLQNYAPAQIVIMKAHVTLALLPLRDDFRI